MDLGDMKYTIDTVDEIQNQTYIHLQRKTDTESTQEYLLKTAKDYLAFDGTLKQISPTEYETSDGELRITATGTPPRCMVGVTRISDGMEISQDLEDETMGMRCRIFSYEQAKFICSHISEKYSSRIYIGVDLDWYYNEKNERKGYPDITEFRFEFYEASQTKNILKPEFEKFPADRFDDFIKSIEAKMKANR